MQSFVFTGLAMDTREQILQEALILFSQRGYGAVSMSDIAERVGITKGALYRHYASKQDIFEKIIRRMEEMDRENALRQAVPEGPYAAMAQKYRETSMNRFFAFTEGQFRYWTEQPFPSAFRKLLNIERYHDGKMEKLYEQYLGSGVTAYIEEIFQGKVEGNVHLLALQFYAPILMLMDNPDDALLKAHLDVWRDKFEHKEGTR